MLANMKTIKQQCLLENLAAEDIVHTAEMLKQLAHPKRLKIIDLLNTATKLPVSKIAEFLELTQSATSQHLTQMRRIGLLNCERQGKTVWYFIADRRPIALLNCICNCCENQKEKK